jgi:hypothetical protein
VLVDDLLPARRRRFGRPVRICDSELICLAIAQVALDCPDERRFLRLARNRLEHLFPYIPGQSGFNKRLRQLAPQLLDAITLLARLSPSFCDRLRLLDSAGGEIVIADKGFAGTEFERHAASGNRSNQPSTPSKTNSHSNATAAARSPPSSAASFDDSPPSPPPSSTTGKPARPAATSPPTTTKDQSSSTSCFAPAIAPRRRCESGAAGRWSGAHGRSSSSPEGASRQQPAAVGTCGWVLAARSCRAARCLHAVVGRHCRRVRVAEGTRVLVRRWIGRGRRGRAGCGTGDPYSRWEGGDCDDRCELTESSHAASLSTERDCGRCGDAAPRVGAAMRRR